MHWPFVSRWTYEQMRRENVLLRDAIKQANAELFKHRRLLADLQDANPSVIDVLARIKGEKV